MTQMLGTSTRLLMWVGTWRRAREQWATTNQNCALFYVPRCSTLRGLWDVCSCLGGQRLVLRDRMSHPSFLIWPLESHGHGLISANPCWLFWWPYLNSWALSLAPDKDLTQEQRCTPPFTLSVVSYLASDPSIIS